MRKLATIQKVHSVKPIEGADFVVRLGILGWTLVSQKGNFETDDLCVYFEVDSQLPDTEEFDFMLEGMSEEDRANPDKVKKALRLRPKKIRKVVSQGLALPIKYFMHKLPKPFKEGDDVTEALGVTKYDPPEDSTPKEIEGKFPFQIPKTDETRIQAVPEILNELNGVECYVSVKMDGQSLTFAKLVDGSTGEVQNKVCTRNFALKDLDGNPHWNMAKKLDIFNKLPNNFAIQGEFCGPGIQGNRLALKHTEFFAFQIWDISNARYLDFADFQSKCAEWGVTTVPIDNPSLIMVHGVDEILTMAMGKYPNGFPREGIVIRPVIERKSKVLEEYGEHSRASFKAINTDFLLKIHG